MAYIGKGIKLRCEYCDKEYLTCPSWIRGQSHHYCSRECYGLANRDIKRNREVKEETREKLRIHMEQLWENGILKSHTPWNKDTKGIMKAWNKNRKMNDYPQMGFQKEEKHWNWIKDRNVYLKNRENDPEKLKPEYANWRKQIYKRDNFKCRINNQDCKSRIEAHHILSWRDYPELRYEINNGITLCQAHHPKRRAEEKRLVPVFQELVSVLNV